MVVDSERKSYSPKFIWEVLEVFHRVQLANVYCILDCVSMISRINVCLHPTHVKLEANIGPKAVWVVQR